MARLILGLLGPFSATLDNVDVTFSYNKVRALLAYLVLEGAAPQRRDHLIGLFWPELPERLARQNLSQALLSLRHAIGDHLAEPPFLLINRDTVQWNRASDYEVDVEQVNTLLTASDAHLHRRVASCAWCAERLAQAATLYRGDLLAQFFLGDSAAFEQWLRTQQEALHERMLTALDQISSYWERRGLYAQARHWAARQLELDPLREGAYRQLMRGLAWDNQRTAALFQYERCARLLRDELGVAPDAQTTALYERIRDGREAPSAISQSYAVLPVPLTSLVGRAHDLARLAELLGQPACRVVTIVGPGGIGKTRLALAGAAEQAFAFRDGVVWVPLAALQAPAHIIPALLGALNLVPDQQRTPEAQLFAYLENKELLLLLDNAEHLLSGMVELVQRLLRAPQVTLLITSREPLALQAEWIFDLEGLPYPTDDTTGVWESYGAVQLFTERALQVRSSWSLADNVVPLAKLCRLVEGMPLALELAAALVREHACDVIASGIETSLHLLQTKLHDVPDRHRSVWAALEHSWQLLAPEEQRVLCEVAVFQGGFMVDAAQAIANATPALLDVLVHKSLLRRATSGRYDFHPLVQHYARIKLHAADATSTTRERHCAYFIAFGERGEKELIGPGQSVWLDRFEQEHDNFRVALHWAVDQQHVAFAVRLGEALWRFWDIHSHLSEGRLWLDKILQLAEAARADMRLHVLLGAGMLALEQHDYGAARLRFEELLALATAEQEVRYLSAALTQLGHLAARQADFEQAHSLYEAGLAIRRTVNDTRGIAISLLSLGRVALGEGDPHTAQRLLEESLVLHMEIGDHDGRASSLLSLAETALLQGDWSAARDLYRESLTQWYVLGHRQGVALVLLGLANIACTWEERPAGLQKAARLFGAADVLRQAVGAPLVGKDQVTYAQNVATLRAALGEAAFQAAWMAGQAMSFDQSVAYCLEDAVAVV